MGSHQHFLLREWSIPLWVLCVLIFVVIFNPTWDAVHYGQVTPILAGLLALGLIKGDYSDVVKGVVVGIVGSVKPTLFMMAPFIGIAYGWRCIVSMTVTSGILLSMNVSYLIEWFYVIRLIADEKEFAGTFLVNLIGFRNAVILGSVISLVVSVIYRKREVAYPALIGITTVCTALWYHGYCMALVPCVYGVVKGVEYFEGE